MAINGVRARLRAIQRKTAVVSIEGADYTVIEMLGIERDRFEVAAFKVSKGGEREVDVINLKARLVALSLLDDDGTRVYKDEEIGELNAELSASVIQSLFEAAQKLNGLGVTAVSDAAKNSETGPAAGSPSA
jgi:hypothetical protein